jgi:hypothetical protein
MFRHKLASFFDKSPVIHYIKQHTCETIGDIVIDVENILLRRYACDGAYCLTLKALPNKLDDYGFTFYNELAAYGDCCRGPVVFISQEESEAKIARRRFRQCWRCWAFPTRGPALYR